ncbi:MAG: glycosyl hydrolase [Kiritimatiellia bacterium]
MKPVMIQNMLRIFTVVSVTLITAQSVSADQYAGTYLRGNFPDPPDSAKPWCYWLWHNSNVDDECIVKDLENIKALGFGGVLFSDTRNYGSHRVKTPPEKFPVYSDEWFRHFSLALDTADRLGLKFTMNISTSGGTLKGPWPTGKDAPKRLVCCTGDAAVPESFTNYHDIAVFAVKVKHSTDIKSGWKNAGGVVDRWTKDEGDRFAEAVEWRELKDGEAIPTDDAAGKWTGLRFGYAMIPNRDYDVDVIDAGAVKRHLERLAGPILKLAGDKIGTTLSHFYSVSWEGSVPTWTHSMEKAFSARAGYSLRAELPALAGWQRTEGRDATKVLKDYRTVRNDLFKDAFYGTFREFCHAHGMQMYSESGGPWNRGESVFKHADQLEFLAINDMPQGEFWVVTPSHHTGSHHVRPAAACARLYGKSRASAEAFTHMDFHWSISPAEIKHVADETFADGINHLVWHTYSASPASQGVPGLVYFAGTHINRNVTWNYEAEPIIRYLSRCQLLLQWGKPVMDLALYAGDNVYSHWDRKDDRSSPWDDAPFEVPRGYTYDVVNTDVMSHRATHEGRGIVLPDGARYRMLVDVSGDTVSIGSLPPPDCEGPFRNVHRTDGRTDIYFLSGEGRANVVFATGLADRKVELWNPLDGSCRPVSAEQMPDGRTRVAVNLPKCGSVFVVFTPDPVKKVRNGNTAFKSTAVKGPWQISFEYMPGIEAKPPSPVRWDSLHYFNHDSDRLIRAFSGTASAKTTFPRPAGRGSVMLGVREIASGVAHIYVNGKDCGLIWCPPWQIEITDALREGDNDLEIRITTTWFNRLVADAKTSEEKRVTKSCLNFFPGYAISHWTRHCMGYCKGDRFRDSGIESPVILTVKDLRYLNQKQKE